MPPQLDCEFITVLRLREALQLRVASPLVAKARTYVPIASVESGDVARRLTSQFTSVKTSAPRAYPAGQGTQDSGEKEGYANDNICYCPAGYSTNRQAGRGSQVEGKAPGASVHGG